MVDSSKTAWGSVAMPFRLRQKLGKDFILVQIVRDPRGVCWSAMRTPWKPEKGPQSPAIAVALGVCAGWLAANLACEAFRLRHPGNAMRVRYEELVKAPEEVVGKILGRAGLTPPPNLKGIAESDNRHQLHGNPMRFKPISPSDLKEDVAWRTAMPRFYRRLVSVFMLAAAETLRVQPNSECSTERLKGQVRLSAVVFPPWQPLYHGGAAPFLSLVLPGCCRLFRRRPYGR